MEKQKTIKKEVKVNGIGIHTGKKVDLCFKPAEKDTGINFVRTDLADKPKIEASIANILDKYLPLRRTSLGVDSAQIHTVEHLLSTLFGLGIDNITIEASAEEIPALDGAAAAFCRILRETGIVELNSPKRTLVLDKPFWLKEGDVFLAAFPDESFKVSYTLSYPDASLYQYLNLEINEDNFTRELAPCKTFCLEAEVETLRSQGLGQGATVDNTIVVGKGGVVHGNPSFSDEFARHKVLDLIGDFCLLAPSIKAHVVAVKTGHPFNIRFLRKVDQMKNMKSVAPPFDIGKIMQILPHRYPFLLVDKVSEFQEGEHIVGVKNVTLNEQFFTGHFPGQPVMPGVLIIEAMAQTAGILMLSQAENRGKLAYFMSMDRVKFRKTVVPGDQLILKTDVVRIKSRTIQIRGRAFVKDKIVAEAEMMFSLVAKNE